MRLVKLKIKNIASLKGEHLIEFDSLTEASSLFAITGETGSGKSTILNAIAMALYGKIYKTNVTQADIVTLGEREGHIQLIFAIRGQYYLADWKGKIRKPNGEPLKQPKLERVIQKIETPNFESARSSEAYVADELLNLNFDQFCKCIILNQGEFAKFLGSSFTERKAILEKLYPGNDIENISKVLKRELDEANHKISIINTQLATLNITPDEGDFLKSKKEKISQEVKIHHLSQKRYTSFSKLFEALEIYYKSYQDNKERLKRISLEIQESTQLFNLSLIETEKKQKELEQVSMQREKRAPLLHELIKKEEQIKILKEQNVQLEANLKNINEQKLQNIREIEEVKTQKNVWSKGHQETLKRFHFSPELLFTFKAELESFLDLKSKIEKLEIEKKNILDKLCETENKGKDLKKSIDQLNEEILKDPAELKNKLATLKTQKSTLQELINHREVQKKTKEQLDERQKELHGELTALTKEEAATDEALKENQTMLKALELNLSLYEYQLNLKKCIEHAKEQEMANCPVCENKLKENFWKELKVSFSENDMDELASQHSKLTTTVNDLKNKNVFLLSQKEKTNQDLQKISKEISLIEKELQSPLASTESIEKEIEVIEKNLINFEHQQKELNRLNAEIMQVRSLYKNLKESLSSLETSLGPHLTEHQELHQKLASFGPHFSEKIEELKSDLRFLVQLTQERKHGEALEQKVLHLEESLKRVEVSTKELSVGLEVNTKKLKELQSEIDEHLKGRSAQEELNALEVKFKEANHDFLKAQQEQKSHEQGLSLKRGNVSSIEQLLKDYELKFIETLSEVRQTSEEEVPNLDENIKAFEEKLKNISLTVHDSVEVIIASKEFIFSTLKGLETILNELNNELGMTQEKLSQWEKTQDRIKLLKLEFNEASSRLDRFKRLSSILGTDELRTFALSLVEENLILQTNEELSNLCDSRYEIIHQSRRGITPEFYILDKFREGGIRKVSTLSGGETFMVSLAMALALAEMTRGQAEIDTLFIDEGFGTLDHESLEDVLEMLGQIQNRGLMIGIISHIKTLTNALPVNLLLNKASDGTSKVSIQYN